jgi:hypothetical protein
MKNAMRVVFAMCFAALLSTLALAQRAVPPPPRPASNGPSLEVTMQFIQEKLNQQGRINVAAYIHDNAAGNDWIAQYGYEMGNVVPHPESCYFSYHLTAWKDGMRLTDHDVGFPIADMQDVIILPVEQVWKENDNRNGITTWSYKSDPPVSFLRARRKTGIVDFVFTDAALADRVAKALVHAVELCGGGNKDPF